MGEVGMGSNINGRMSFEYLKSNLYDVREVVVLPYRKYIDDKSERCEFLVSLEESPTSQSEINLNPIISMVGESDESPVFTALRGLYSETGYKISDEDLISLGKVRLMDSADSMCLLYTVNLSEKIARPKVNTDGISIERDVIYDWYKSNDVIGANNTILNIMMKLMEKSVEE